MAESWHSAPILGQPWAVEYSDPIFAHHSQPLKETNTKTWKWALRTCGIRDFRWHDLRHTWASWHVQSGTPLQVLQELGGWSCYEMVLRYAHLSADHLADYAENLCRIHKVTGTLSGTAQLKVVRESS